MRQRTQEQDCLILLGHDGVVGRLWPVHAVFPTRVVEAKFASLKMFGLTVEEIDEGDFAGGNFPMSVIVVPTEEISVVAGRDLSFDPRDWKRLVAELLEHSRQEGLDAIPYHITMNT